jgi:hypothetical protein
MALFGTPKPLSTYQRQPDEYYKHIWFTKPLFEGIEFLAKTERKSKKKMANELMELGLRKFMGEKIREYNKRVIAARQLEQEPELTRFIILLRRFAKERGMDISKFI